MAKFLSGNSLSKKIKQVCAGDDVCCAVAFWGIGAKNGLFGTKSDRYRKARIICDLTMGGTNPGELVVMGSPRSGNIRHVGGLHAKVYLSDLGVVIASANASENGVGFSAKGVGLHEAGSFSKADSSVWQTAHKWFETQWAEAKKVSRSDLNDAERRWTERQNAARNSSSKKKSNRKMSIVEALRDAPEIFGQMRFALTCEKNDEEVVTVAEELFAAEYGETPKGKNKFEGWGLTKSQWPIEFISIYQGPKGGLWIRFLQRGHVQKAKDSDVHFAPVADIFRDKPDLAKHLDPSIGKRLCRDKSELPKGFIETIPEDRDEIFLMASEVSALLRSYET